MAKAMRKVRTGSVVRASKDKTAVVEMVWKQRHRLYRKQVRRVARFRVHDPLGQCRPGDLVLIQETRPISKTKRWRLLEILERHQVAEVRAIELESDAAAVLSPPPADDDAGVHAEEAATGEEGPEDQGPVTEEEATEE